jgi:heterodisulfide reductase subunit A-like polyferredoxin
VVLVAGSGPAAVEAAREIVVQGGKAILVRPGEVKRQCSLRTPAGFEIIEGTLVQVEGSPGRFRARLRSGDEDLIVECAAVVLAPGQEVRPSKAGAVSLSELSVEGVSEGVRSVAFVLSDNAPRPSFVRAVRAARELRSRASRPAVTVFAAEMAAYGTDELEYRQAQAEGVIFVRTSEPTVTTHPPKVVAVDQVTGLEVEVSPELLVAEEAAEEDAEITASPGGYAVLEGPPGRGAVSTMREGVSSPGPGNVRLDGEAITGAKAAATRALTVAMFPPDRASQAAIVDRERCAACLTCARVCPFGAAHPAEEGKASIDATLCQACGICVGACPARALSLPSYGAVPDKESAVLVEGRR